MKRCLPGEGEIIEERHINALSREIAEHVVKSRAGGKLSRSGSGEELVKQLQQLLDEPKK